ncbi:hypothetical protein [Pseudomonas lurida]|uniref:hypothetical protein n=1 Tax=Pseudomonas lurida TaxID=244566 RepID=UPI00223BE261|nr:hypothetical protein [Pseudomonas lurida]
MLSISQNRFAQPVVDPCQVSAYSASASLETVGPHTSSTETQAARLGTKSEGAGDNADPAALMGRLVNLFMTLFSQLQSLLLTGGLPSAPKSSDIALTQPHVLPTHARTRVNKRSEPLSELSTKRNGAKPDNIWNGFRQGKNGNCVTISAIKAAMMKFGQSPMDIYTSVEKVAEGYNVVMRDGFELKLTHAELNSAVRGSNFVGLNDPEMLKDAHFLFACSAKRAQIENNDGWARRSFNAAIRSLNDGEDEWGPGEGFKRLGLKDYMRHVSVRAFADKSLIGMVNRRGHSVAVVGGSEEIFGRKGGRPTNGQAIALI